MTTSATLRLLTTGGLVLCGVWAACAAPREPTKKPPAQISIENGRKVALTAFEIVPLPTPAKPGAKAAVTPKPILKLEVPLAAGESAMVTLRGTAGCSYLARWTFEDAGDEAPVDLCGDPKIVLTD